MTPPTHPAKSHRLGLALLVVLMLILGALSVAAGIAGDLLGALGFALVALLGGVAAYLLIGDDRGRDPAVQRLISRTALFFLLPLTLIVQLLGIIR